MNHFFLTSLLALTVSIPSLAQPYSLRNYHTLEGHQLQEHDLKAVVASPECQTHRAPMRAAAVQDSISYTAFSQSFYGDNGFMYEGGYFSKYKASIVWYEDGSVRIEGLFNLRSHSNCGDQELPLWGTYDAASGIITIPTPSDELTPVALLYGQLNGYLMAGTVYEDYNFYSSSNLELKVSDDGHTIETLQDALILEEYNDELSTHTCIDYVKLYSACEGQKLVTFSYDKVNFANPLYPGTSQTKSLYIANVGSQALNYELTVDDDASPSPFTVKPTSGSLRSMIMKEVKVTYTPQQVGNDAATLHITSEGGGTDLPIVGSCMDTPDYSFLVEEGEVSFRTCVDFPFEHAYDGLDEVARSTIGYNKGESWLEAIVEVPAGKIGTLAWTGHSYSDFYWGSKSLVTADDEHVVFESYYGDEVFDGHYMFTEGEHRVRFNFNINYPEFVTDADCMILSGVSFTTFDIEPNAAIQPLGSQLSFGNFVEQLPTCTLYARLLNTGSDYLSLASVESSEHFQVSMPDQMVSMLDTLCVPVSFEIPAAGIYNEDIVLHTTAGDFTYHCSARVRTIPDYSVLLTADCDPSVEVNWSYSTTQPFVIDPLTNEAVNCNARETDTIANAAWMEAAFVIPEGKVGVVSWDAKLDIEDIQPDGTYHDYGMVYITHPSRQFGIIQIGKGDLSSEGCYNCWDMEEATAQYYTSGENRIRWILSHFGDSYYEGKDELRVSNLSITLEDFPEYAYELSVDSIDFGELLLGRTTYYTVKLTNMGGQVLTIDSYDIDEPATLVNFPVYACAYRVGFDLKFAFEGLWPGENEGEIHLFTSAGEVVIPYRAYVVDPEGYLLAEDFEGDINWYRTDADGDGKGWNSLYNIYSTMSDGHCHSGIDGLGSSGYYYYLGDIDPDDWCYSSMFQIPAEGEYELSWWMGVDEEDYTTYGHHYSVYVGEEMNRQTLTEMYTEQISGTGWQHHVLNLKQWAGKEVCVSFRHFDSEGLGIMKLDDVYVRPATESAIRNVRNEASSVRIYNLQGQPLQHLGKGVNILCSPQGQRVTYN